MGLQVLQTVPELTHLLDDDVRIGFMDSDQAKTFKGKNILGECIRTQDLYAEFCPYDFLIVVYGANCEGMTDKQREILLEHELLHVGVEITRKGDVRYFVRPHDYDDFKSITDKYGTDWARV